LSGDLNVCAGLETLANYILYSPDGERLDQKVEYNFYTDKQEFKNRMTELSLNYFEDMDESIDFLEDTCRNYLLETNQKVYATDLKKFPVLKEYNTAIDCCTILLKNEVDMKLRYKIGKCISDLRKIQADLKSSLTGTIIFKHISPIGEKLSEPNIDGFDFESVKKMFLNANMKQMTPFGELGDVFLDILDKIEKNDAENSVLSLFVSENKPNYAEIARKIDVSANFIHQTVGKLRNKIIKEYMKRYEDWYFTFEDYGWYKKCSVCGETKLLSPTYFQKNSSSNDGFRPVCKLCT